MVGERHDARTAVEGGESCRGGEAVLSLDAKRRALHATPNQHGYDSDDRAIEQVRLRCPE
jgi:hypothetical protein